MRSSGNHGLWSSYHDRQVRVHGFSDTVCLSVPGKPTQSPRQYSIQVACVSLCSLEVSEDFRSFPEQLVLDINRVYPWQMQLYSSWQLSLYSVYKKCVKCLIVPSPKGKLAIAL